MNNFLGEVNMNDEKFLMNILDLIYIYTRKKEILDIDLIQTIIDTIINCVDINYLVHRVAFLKENKYKWLSIYYPNSKTLYINYSRVLSDSINTVLHRNLYSIDEEKIFEINLAILKVILHELEHVYQIKMLEDPNDTLESKLLRVSYEPYLVKGEILSVEEKKYAHDFKKYLFKEGYAVDPAERFANIRAGYTICNMLGQLPEYALVKEYAERDLNRELLSGYVDLGMSILSPTEEFLNNRQRLLVQSGITRADDIISGTISQDYSLSLKLYHGLNISREEYLKSKNKR